MLSHGHNDAAAFVANVGVVEDTSARPLRVQLHDFVVLNVLVVFEVFDLDLHLVFIIMVSLFQCRLLARWQHVPLLQTRVPTVVLDAVRSLRHQVEVQMRVGQRRGLRGLGKQHGTGGFVTGGGWRRKGGEQQGTDQVVLGFTQVFWQEQDFLTVISGWFEFLILDKQVASSSWQQ